MSEYKKRQRSEIGDIIPLDIFIGQKALKQNQWPCLPNTIVSPEAIQTNVIIWMDQSVLHTVCFRNCFQ